jgi:site-specific recombinase XerD
MPKTQRISEIELCVRDFVTDVQAARRAPGTIAFYRSKLTEFAAFLATEGATEPQDISPALIRRFLASLQDSHSEGGVHAYWRAMRAFLRFLVREDVLASNPLDKVRSPKIPDELLDPVTPESVMALVDACDGSIIGKRDRAIFLTLLDTGLRAGELCALTVGNLDLTDNSLRVERGKGGKGRMVFVGAQTRRALRAYLRERRPADHEPLFEARHTTGERGPLTYNGLRAIVTRRARQAGIDPPPSLHSFRRAFAIALLRSGADVASISRMMGHGSLPVVLRYLKQMRDDLAATHAQHSPVDGMRRARR